MQTESPSGYLSSHYCCGFNNAVDLIACSKAKVLDGFKSDEGSKMVATPHVNLQVRHDHIFLHFRNLPFDVVPRADLHVVSGSYRLWMATNCSLLCWYDVQLGMTGDVVNIIVKADSIQFYLLLLLRYH